MKSLPDLVQILLIIPITFGGVIGVAIISGLICDLLGKITHYFYEKCEERERIKDMLLRDRIFGRDKNTKITKYSASDLADWFVRMQRYGYDTKLLDSSDTLEDHLKNRFTFDDFIWQNTKLLDLQKSIKGMDEKDNLVYIYPEKDETYRSYDPDKSEQRPGITLVAIINSKTYAINICGKDRKISVAEIYDTNDNSILNSIKNPIELDGDCDIVATISFIQSVEC